MESFGKLMIICLGVADLIMIWLSQRQTPLRKNHYQSRFHFYLSACDLVCTSLYLSFQPPALVKSCCKPEMTPSKCDSLEVSRNTH